MLKRLLKPLWILLALAIEMLALTAAIAGGPWTKSGVTKTGLSGTEVYVFTYNLTVYEEPTKKSEVAETVPYAKRILLLAEKKGWAKVFTTNGKTGYCNAKQLTETDPNVYSTTVYGQASRAPIYLRPSLDAPLLGHLHQNEKTTMVAITPKHDWLRIQNGKYYGYIQRPYVDYKEYAEAKDVKDAWVNRESVRVYYDPDVDSTYGTIYFGQRVTLVDVEKGWAKIRSSKGLMGYCDAASLTDIDPNSLDITVYTQVDGNYLFTSSTDLSGRRPVSANTEMLLSAVDQDHYWARVRYQDQYFYVPYVFLGTERRRGDYKKVRTVTECQLHEGTTRSSKIVTNLPVGTTLLLIGCTDTCAKVATEPISNGARFVGFVDIAEIQ